jgi:AraC-like DNA-binding protein
MSLHNLDILNAAVGLLSFLIFFIHWMGNKKPSLPNFLFRSFLIANAYYFIIAALIQNESILTVPHLFRTGSIAGLLATPLVYLILIKSLKNEPWKKIDYLHFVPVVLYIIDFLPFFILPTVSKLEVIEHLIGSGDTATLGFGEGWIFNGAFWIIIKVIQPLTYSGICFVTLYQIIGNSGNSFKKENRKLIQLLYWLSIYLLLITIPIGLSFAGLTGLNGWKITSAIIFSSTLITCLFLLFNPEVLYGLKGIWITSQENDLAVPKKGHLPINEPRARIETPGLKLEMSSNLIESEIRANISRETYLSVRQVENMEKVLSNYMNKTQAYLQQGFSLPQLAKETNFQLQQVSAFLNQHMGENFNDYINKFRINHLISLYEQDPNIIDQFTLEYLGKESGFGSRSAFITSFKKFTGQTPSAYFKP